MTFEKIPITSEKTYSFEGYFDIKATYKTMKDFVENSLHYWDVTEKDFGEKNLGSNKEIDTTVEAEKIYNDYFKIILKYNIKMSGKEIEGELDGKKMKITKGSAKLTVNCYIQPDWGGGREAGPLKKFLGQVYDKFVGNDEMGKCAGAAGEDIAKIISKFKHHMYSTVKEV